MGGGGRAGQACRQARAQPHTTLQHTALVLQPCDAHRMFGYTTSMERGGGPGGVMNRLESVAFLLTTLDVKPSCDDV